MAEAGCHMGRRRAFGESEAPFRPRQPERRSSKTMARARLLIALAGLSVAGACGQAPPPVELDGLWSAGLAACEAGVGVRFGIESIEAVYDERTETLFAHPRYEVLEDGRDFRVRITYELPYVAGGVRSAGAHGVVTLARLDDRLEPVGHALIDGRTGAARVRLVDDPVSTALSLTPCGGHPWREPLRGRSEI
jgi:hypothetical protein